MISFTRAKKYLPLTFIAFVAIVAVVIVQSATVEKRQWSGQNSILSEIIPAKDHDNDLVADTIPILEDFRQFLGLVAADDRDKKIHIARKNGVPFAAIIPTVALDGYSSGIEMIVGVNADGTIAGLRVTAHNETPGLADYIDVRKSNWILTFNGKDIRSNFNARERVKKNRTTGGYDQMTGATITRKAVILQVKKTLSYFQIAQPLAAAAQ
ncbi:MAG: RnfABCDGE type electron transport complex subunit G [Oceanicoccus sp.]